MATKVIVKIPAKVQWEAKSLDVDPRNYSLAKQCAREQGIEIRVFLNSAIAREINRHYARRPQ